MKSRFLGQYPSHGDFFLLGSALIKELKDHNHLVGNVDRSPSKDQKLTYCDAAVSERRPTTGLLGDP